MEKLEIIQDEYGNNVVLIPDIIFVNKQNYTLGEKMYLYDLVDIKKEASNPFKTHE